jgi:hypothetical protein
LSEETNPKAAAAASASASAAVSACDPSSYANATCSSNRKHRVAALANIATPAACCSACSANARCKAWTHYGSTKCNLFSTGDGPHAGPCVSGGVTPPTPPTPVPPAGAICKDCPNIILMITVIHKGNDARQRDRETGKQRHRETGKQRNRDTEIQRHRDTERQTKADKGRQRQTKADKGRQRQVETDRGR